ncbi:hypothetical protein JB92DRAFT_2790557, partial [Gautieria morchelliformis]
MLSILRTRAVALPGFSSTARFLPVLPAYGRTLSSTTLRAFTASHVSRQYGEGRRGGFNDRYDSSPRESRSTPRPPRNAPSSTLWVGNLPFNANPEAVQDLFSEFGTVLSVRLGVAPTGESKGFAHVDLSDVASAEAVMQANAESQFFLEGRGLNLDYAGPPSSKASFPPNTTLHFSNYSGDEEGLQTVLEEFAPSIKSLRIMRNPQTGATNRFGFIEFNTQETATAALEKFNGKEVAYGETLGLSYARARKDGPPPRYVDQGGDGFGYGARGRSGGYNSRPQGGYGGRGGPSRAAGEEPY